MSKYEYAELAQKIKLIPHNGGGSCGEFYFLVTPIYKEMSRN